ncbi:MAG: DUF1987 domain-containing protein [Acidobacteriota bacterium]|nr:DUF1987 domain-containing protein [Blastocatellia bacterium]MDW8412993.1 DUF1987 domain-containing protein [Acidobacteriota bacterium]
MENLFIEKTRATPAVRFDAASGVLEISGESYPENSMKFYQPVFSWLQQYLSETDHPITFNFKLDYFNTSSSKCILNILEMLEQAHAQGRQISLNWYYQEDDEDMLESGQEFAEDLSLHFNFISF